MCRLLPSPRSAAFAAGGLLAGALALHFAGNCAPPAFGSVRFDFEPRVFAPTDHYVKDHTVLKVGDRYHLIYTMGTDSLGRGRMPGNEISFGHATSPDLRHWTEEPPLLAGERAPWEERNRWAPHLLPRAEGGFRLYYTGVDRYIAQAIGIATAPPGALRSGTGPGPSADPFVPLADNPIFRPDTAWARWEAGTWSNCRDPFVFAHESAHWLLVTATTRDRRGAIGLAHSTDGGGRFVDAGLLVIGEAGEALESPQLHRLDGRWFLLFTPDRRGGTWVIEAPDFRGPWESSARTRLLPSIAPEIVAEGDTIWISTHDAYTPVAGARRRYVIGFDRVRVGPAGLEVVPENGLGPDWPFVEGDAFSAQPTLGDNPVARGEPGAGLIGNGYLSSSESFTWPLGSPGASRGTAPTGRLRSRPFILRGDVMTLLVGGTASPDSVYVALRRHATGEILFRETGHGVGTMDLRSWDLRAVRGVEVDIEIADLTRSGSIHVDEIVEHMSAEAPQAAP